MAKRKKEKKVKKRKSFEDNGAYLPTPQQIWGKGGLTEQFRQVKLYPADDRKRSYGKTMNNIVRTDSMGLPTVD